MSLKIAIIGRPNVGKSTLFNRLAGRKIAIVHDQPGVTRDRREALAKLRDLDLRIIDTAGYEYSNEDNLERRMWEQTKRAIEDADVCLFLFDARSGLQPYDEHFADILRQSGKPVVLLANKCEGKAQEDGIHEAYKLGMGQPIPFSAEHGLGINDLYEALKPFDKKKAEQPAEDDKSGEKNERPLQLAIVGRPNVGKSTLFNKLIGKRLSIVENTPGVPRDRIYAKCEWRDRAFMIVDTGGIEPTTEDVILKQMREQAQLAIEQADVIILVTDVRCGVTADDSAVANMLQKSGKPIILAVNKCDKIGEPPMELYEFYNLGLGDPFPVSAEHGHGSGDMLDAVYDALPPESELEEQDDAIRVAIIGKPNVGKSSLVNRIAGEQRVIVSNVAGTTRDATDTTVENEEGKFVLIDTAGIRRKSKVTEKIEQYSVLRAYMAVDRADVCLIVIDATEGFTEQDSKVAGYAHEQGKASIFVVNKWYLVEKDGNTMQNFEEELRGHFSFMSYVPFLFLSAKTGQRVSKLFGMIKDVHQQNSIRVTTGTLNDILAYATTRVQPPSDKGRRLKIYYMTQPSTNPPTFVVFVNRADLFHFSYQRYLENQIRASFGLTGTPVRFVVRERNRDDQS